MGSAPRAAMKDWRLCSDGRLYHAVVAEKALEAWLERLAHRRLGAVGNAKRWGVATDIAAVETAMAEACSRLLALNPQSRVLARASTKHPAWNRCGIATGSPDESREDRKEKEKVKEKEKESQERKKDNAAL